MPEKFCTKCISCCLPGKHWGFERFYTRNTLRGIPGGCVAHLQQESAKKLRGYTSQAAPKNVPLSQKTKRFPFLEADGAVPHSARGGEGGDGGGEHRDDDLYGLLLDERPHLLAQLIKEFHIELF